MGDPVDAPRLLGAWWAYGWVICGVVSAILHEMAMRRRRLGVTRMDISDYVVGNSSFFVTRGSPDHLDQRGLELLRRRGKIKLIYLAGIPIDFGLLLLWTW
jgi:hypothetical protein